MSLLESVSSFISSRFSSPANRTFLCAVSGGPDSMVLLELLVRLKRRFEFRLYPVHYNHRIHERADAAEQLVVRRAREQRLCPIGSTVRVPGRLEEGRAGLEANARRMRYAFFASLQAALNADGVFLGHHRDDQIEALLLNLGRGSGLYGLQAMGPITRMEKGLTLLRPLLACSSDRIEQYARENDVPFVRDPTNLDLSHARNRIRHRVLPQWTRAQPDPETAMYRLSLRARRENAFWEEYLKRRFDVWSWRGELQVVVTSFLDAHRAARDRLLHALPRRLSGHARGWSEKNVNQLHRLFEPGQSGNRLSLPGELEAIREYNRVAVFRGGMESPTLERELSWSGGTWTVSKQVRGFFGVDRSSVRTAGFPYRSELDFTSRPRSLTLRYWRPGDRILLRDKSRPVVEIFKEKRIPFRARRRWPLILADETVVCVLGLAVADTVQEGENRRFAGFRDSHPSFHQISVEGDSV